MCFVSPLRHSEGGKKSNISLFLERADVGHESGESIRAGSLLRLRCRCRDSTYVCQCPLSESQHLLVRQQLRKQQVKRFIERVLGRVPVGY
jgi:hypothetical protein